MRVHHAEPGGHVTVFTVRTIVYDPERPTEGVWLTTPDGRHVHLASGRAWREDDDGRVVASYPISPEKEPSP